MNRCAATFVAISATVLAACQTPQEQNAVQIASAALNNSAGEQVGNARLYRQSDVFTVNIAISQLSQGHASARLSPAANCDADSDGSSAGALGELPGFRIGEDGAGTMSAILARSPFDAGSASVRVYWRDAAGTERHAACGTITPS